MAYAAINDNEIEVGDPLKKEIMDKIQDNFADHETRISSVESGAQKVVVFKTLVMNASSANTLTGLLYYIADDAFTLTSATIQIFEKGSLGGALEINLKKSTTDLDNPSFATVFVTAPRITMGAAANYDISSNQVFDNNQVSIAAGDIIRFDVTEMPTSGVLGKFLLNVYGEKS